MNESNIVEEYDFVEPETDELYYLLDKVSKDFRSKFFHTFNYRCVYDIKFTNITNNERDILNSGHDCFEFRKKCYGSKNNQKCRI